MTSRMRACTMVPLLVTLLLAGCQGDAAQPARRTDATVVLTGLDHTLLGSGGRRGTVRADTALFDDRLGVVRLYRPVLEIAASPIRAQPIEIAADSGTLEVGTEIVRLIRPNSVMGAPATLMNADTVAYDPAGDSLWAVPGGRIR